MIPAYVEKVSFSDLLTASLDFFVALLGVFSSIADSEEGAEKIFHQLLHNSCQPKLLSWHTMLSVMMKYCALYSPQLMQQSQLNAQVSSKCLTCSFICRWMLCCAFVAVS